MPPKKTKIMNTPMSANLSITSRCNLRCSYCSHFTSASDVNLDLPAKEWLNFFEELNRCSVLYLTLQGGEPFCREDLKELIQGITSNRMRYRILSNGTLITDNIASFLASTGRCDMVQVSIDGAMPSTHDIFRGEGNFRKAVQGIRHLQRHLVPVSVRVTIHRQNVHELSRIAKLLIEDIGLKEFSTNAASYMGLCRKNTEQVQLTLEERSIAMNTLLKLSAKYDGRILADAGPLAEGKAWLQMERACREKRGHIPGGGYLSGCSGPMKTIAVRSDGIMVPCIHLSHIELGRINRDDLRDIWLNHTELKRLRERQNIPLNVFDYCKDCDYIDYCTGNCPALAYIMTGDENRPSSEDCLRRFLEMGGHLPEPLYI